MELILTTPQDLKQILKVALSELKVETTPTAQTVNEQPDRTDINGAIEETGYTKNTIYKLVHEGKIPYHKPDGASKLIFYRSELQEWIKGAKKETAKEYAGRKASELIDKRKGCNHGK